MRKIVVTNDKGGVAKTTTVANLGVGLSQQGYKTLVLDMDPQGDATYALLGGRPPLLSETDSIPRTMYTLILEKHTLGEVALKAPRYPNLWVVPSNKDLAQAGAQLSSKPGSQTVLDYILQKVKPATFDFVLIDTGKGLDLLVINALAAADEVIIMTTPGKFELDAVQRMQNTIQEVRTRVHRGGDRPRIIGIVLAHADHYSVARDTKAYIEANYQEQMFQTVIPKNDDLKKAISRAQSIFEFNDQSKGAQAYMMLLEEVIAYYDKQTTI